MRRVFIPQLSLGDQPLPADQAHHLRDVLRLSAGTAVQAFDRAGNHATGELVSVELGGVIVRIKEMKTASMPGKHDDPGAKTHLTVAAAVPKGARADWMIEKLSELGTDVFIPLAAARSVALPEGKGKLDRWKRIAEESAKQSGRTSVMAIEPLKELKGLLDRRDSEDEQTWYLSTDANAHPIVACLDLIPARLTLLIGPEGGWTAGELEAFTAANFRAMRLTQTILRIETAAVAAAAIVLSALTACSTDATIEPPDHMIE
jgi:16S rRNA (uracil1498-N3)-methyltransferase